MLEETGLEGCLGGDGVVGMSGGMQLLQCQPLLPRGPCLCSETCVGPFGKGHRKGAAVLGMCQTTPWLGMPNAWMQPKPILECPRGSSPCDLTSNTLKCARKGKPAGICCLQGLLYWGLSVHSRDLHPLCLGLSTGISSQPCPSHPTASQGASRQGEPHLVLLKIWNAHLGGCRAMEFRSEWLELSRK